MSPTNYPPSGEELELMQEYGGHEPYVGEVLLAALRKKSLLEAEEQAYRQRLRAFLEHRVEGSD